MSCTSCVRKVFILCWHLAMTMKSSRLSCVRRAFILCWHHRENKHLLFIETLKVKTTSITAPTSLLNLRSLTCQPVYLLTSWPLCIAITFVAHHPSVYSPLPLHCVGRTIGLTTYPFSLLSSFPLACARTIYNIWSLNF